MPTITSTDNKDRLKLGSAARQPIRLLACLTWLPVSS